MRWKDLDGNVVRVAKVGTGGVCVALYPTKDRDAFSYESFREIDELGMRIPIFPRDEIEDEVFVRLLDGDGIQDILREFQPTPLGEEREGDSRYSYYHTKKAGEPFDMLNCGTFHIASDSIEQATN